ncbi:UDP-glucose/GDP-mannose dehydrogenase family protein [Candidatus Kaiserbacteria bacterium]|nr:UDP-glucose/GDP-mannose dehydrogenase family protein [Candidatus Kaiserbacteria bacterium]
MTYMRENLRIGFIGQGFVGKSYADDFEQRGHTVIRYALEEPYRANKGAVKNAHIVFIAVPTPTTPTGFDLGIVESSLRLVGEGKIAVIKSTVLPGTTRRLQKKFPRIIILFSPEFLNATTAAQDAANPFANVIGVPQDTDEHRAAAALVHSVLPNAAFVHTCSSDEAEVYKYAHNVAGYMQVLTYNLMYDMAREHGAEWDAIQKALEADPMVSNWYIKPVHKSGRGAGGACFIKDTAAFTHHYEKTVGHPAGIAFLKAAQEKNLALLVSTEKDLDLLEGVYGKAVVARARRKHAAPRTTKKKAAKPAKEVSASKRPTAKKASTAKKAAKKSRR